MAFSIIWDEKARESLRKLQPMVSRRIVKKVKELENSPYSGDVKKIKGSEEFRLRVGDYRVIFGIVGDVIMILKIGHRKNIYKH